MTWFKSSFSNGNGGNNCVEINFFSSAGCATSNCVEVGFHPASSCANGSCVEVSHVEDQVLVRDSKDPSQTPLSFTYSEWDAFIAGVKAGEFDRPNG